MIPHKKDPRYLRPSNIEREQNGMFGKYHTKKTKEKISLTKIRLKQNSGSNNPMYGRNRKIDTWSRNFNNCIICINMIVNMLVKVCVKNVILKINGKKKKNE